MGTRLPEVVTNECANEMLTVARYMYDNAHKYGFNPTDMFLLGYLHKIGKTLSNNNYATEGAILLFDHYYPYNQAVQYSRTLPSEYLEQFDCERYDIPKELILLWDAMMHTTDNGSFVSYEDKLVSVKKDSREYEFCKTLIEWLETYIEDFYV